MVNFGTEYRPVTIEDVLGVDLCARAILEYVPAADLVRSERVSRQWSRAVRDYLSACRTLCLYDICYNKSTSGYPSGTHRKINISFHDSSLLASKTVKKLGPSIETVITERSDEEYFEAIASNCPYLRLIMVGVTDVYNSQLNLIKKFKQLKALKQISIHFFHESQNSDRVLSELFHNIDCEKIEIKCNSDLTGLFLKHINLNNLKSLNISQCTNLDANSLLSGIQILRNITSLGLDENGIYVFRIVHLLLKEMPQLEELSLSGYREFAEMNEDSIEPFSRLANLKRLNMSWNYAVNDKLLEALARGCPKLEYLNIRNCFLACIGDSFLTARGLAALCRRSPSAVTAFYFGFQDETYDEKFAARCRDNLLIPELMTWCCLELTTEWWEATCSTSRRRKHPVEMNSGCNAVQAQDHRHKLRISAVLKPWSMWKKYFYDSTC